MIKKAIITNSSLMLAGLILNFLFRIYLAHHISKSDLVIYYTLLDTVTLITMIFVGFKDTLNKTFYHCKNKENQIYTYNTLVFIAIFIAQVIVLPIVYFEYLSSKIDIQNDFILISFMFFSLSIVIYLGNILLVHRIYKITSISDFLKITLFIVSFFILYFSINLKLEYRYLIYALIISNILIISLFLYYLPIDTKKLFKLNFNLYDLKQFIQNGIISSSEYFIATLILYSAIILFIDYFSVDETALFQVVAKPIYLALISVFSFPIFRFLLPEFSKLISENNISKILSYRKKFIKYNFLFGLVLIILGFIFVKYIIAFMFPIEYIDSQEYIKILIIAIPFITYNSFAFSVIKGFGYFKWTLLIRTIGLSSFLIFFYIFLYLNFQSFSIIYALLFSNISMSIASYYFERKLLKGTL